MKKSRVIISFFLAFLLLTQWVGCSKKKMENNISDSEDISSSTISSVEEKFFDVSYDNLDFEGPNKIKAGGQLIFSYTKNSYDSNELKVYANGNLINYENGKYTILNVDTNIKITSEKIVKDKYSIELMENKELYDIYSSSEKIVEPNGTFTFNIRFWGDEDLSNVSIKANNTTIEPKNFQDKYYENTLYTYEINNINRDVKITVNGCKKMTWFKYDFCVDEKIVYQKASMADLKETPQKLGYKFVGWTLEKDNLDTIIQLPYQNNTQEKEITFYAFYIEDISSIQLPIINIDSSSQIDSKDYYVNAKFSLKDDKNDIEAGCSIKIRGNSTATYEKKPYKIKFNSAQSFYGSSKFKTWVLLADYLDPSLIRNYYALNLANKIGTSNFTFTTKHIELYINNVYQGVYLLTDQVQESNKGRVNIEVDSIDDNDVPFLLERDKDGEGIYGKNWFTVGISNFIIKYPEEPTQKQFDYIYTYISKVYELITEKNIDELRKYVDIESLIDYSLINEIMVNIDSNWKSGFMYRTTNGKLVIGPVWDFDWSLTTWTSHPCTNNEFELQDKYFLLKRDETDFSFDWMIYLIQNESFYDKVVERFQDIKKYSIDLLNSTKKYFEYLYDAGMRNYSRWYEKDYKLEGSANYTPIENLFVDQFNYVTKSLEKRIDCMDEELTYNNFSKFYNINFN